MAAHPNVTVEITALENEAFKTKLTTVMQSGEPPDIFQSWGGGVMNEYAEAGLLKDITADLDADGGAWREFLEDVQKLKDAGITPIALGEGDKWPGMHMWAYLVTRLGGKANFEGALLRTGSFTDAPFVDAGYKLQEL